jgi:hypothetical protein
MIELSSDRWVRRRRDDRKIEFLPDLIDRGEHRLRVVGEQLLRFPGDLVLSRFTRQKDESADAGDRPEVVPVVLIARTEMLGGKTGRQEAGGLFPGPVDPFEPAVR